jgi:DNA-binding MarR family transcriptional regulator
MSNSVRKRSAAVAAWTRLVRIQQRIDAASDQHFHESGLNAAWFDVVARVGTRPGLSQGELADTLLVTKGNVSQLIVKMEAAGLVERRSEGRFQRLFLTPQGQAIHDDVVPRQEALLERSLSGLSLEEQNQLLRLLRRWEEA